ncbi:Cyclic nucleotide-binding protein [Pseudocohnilembus persalinus]|uniref:Cyclic nucleotide-binding protein n=1 Tax=Pseudocohnilembus persalinus TaxID=266149 RepID=A0A0V0QPQ3_PSEPJ|nr:Cyclic nucleotide-binding protein [Pseudocohnilembus persalinus]|eukprot:KRX04286.1 Cyclic nucleotide-binding protein [Pseudocohnilembus persalinus]
MQKQREDLSIDESINWEYLDQSSNQREQINNSYQFNPNFQNQSIHQLIGQDSNSTSRNNTSRQFKNQLQFAKVYENIQNENNNGSKTEKPLSIQTQNQNFSQQNNEQQFSNEIKFSQTPGRKNRQLEHLKTKQNSHLQSSQAMSGHILSQIEDSANMSQRSKHVKSPFEKKLYNGSTLLDKKKTLKYTQNSANSISTANPQKLALRLKQPRKKLRYFTQVVMNLTYVTAFLQIMKELIFGSISVKKLSDLEIEALNDYSHSQEQFKASAKMKEQMRTKILNQKKKTLTDCLWQVFFKIVTCFPIIRPNLRMKMFFDCYFGYLVLFRMYFTTIKYVFFLTDLRGSVNIIKGYTIFLINFSFLIDIFISFHTGYYEHGLLIMDRKKIAIRYIKTSFFSDVLVQIPMIFQLAISEQSSFNVIVFGYVLESMIFLKIFSLNTLVKRCERVVSENEIGAAWWPLLSLIVKILILAHFLGCFYFLVGVYQIEYLQDERNWIQALDQNYFGNKPLYDQGWFLKYLVSIFWSLGIMIQSVLEIPQTKIELIFTCVFVVIMTGTLGYVISTIGQILDNIEKKNKKYRLERERTFRFLNKKEIPEKLKERVTLYLDYVHEYEKQRNLEEEKLVLDRMPKQLKRDLLLEVNKGKINFFQAISENFGEQTLKELTLEIKSSMFATGDIIFNEGQTPDDDDFSLYVVSKGKVQMFYSFPNGEYSVIGYKNEGTMFGEVEFFTGQPREWGIRAVQPSSILSIKRSRFIEILQKNEQDKERFCFIKDKLIQNKTSIEFPQFCSLCQGIGHFPKSCPNTHFNIDLKQLIYDYNTYDIQINRSTFNRIELKSHNALLDYDDIKECAIEIIQQDYDDYLKEETMKIQEMQLIYEEEQIEEDDFCSFVPFQQKKKDKERRGSKKQSNLQNLNPEHQFAAGDGINMAISSFNQHERSNERRQSYHLKTQEDQDRQRKSSYIGDNQYNKFNIQVNSIENQNNLPIINEKREEKSKIINDQKEMIKILQNQLKIKKGQEFDNMVRQSHSGMTSQIRHNFFNNQRQSNNLTQSNELDQSYKHLYQSKDKLEKNVNSLLQNTNKARQLLFQPYHEQKIKQMNADIYTNFDKIQEFEIYYTQFNYSQISKQENLKHIFQVETKQTEEEDKQYSQAPSGFLLTNKMSKRSLKIRQETGSSRILQDSVLQNQKQREQQDDTKYSFSPYKQGFGERNKFSQITLVNKSLMKKSPTQQSNNNLARHGKTKTYNRRSSSSPKKKIDFQFKYESDSEDDEEEQVQEQVQEQEEQEQEHQNNHDLPFSVRDKRVPKILHKCGHTMCQNCIEKINKLGIVKCPFCKEEYKYTCEKDFPNNFLLQNMIEQQSNDTSSAQKLVVNPRKKVKKQLYFGSDDSNDDSVKESYQFEGVCVEHQEQKYEFYCKQCKLFICKKCLSSHQKHEIHLLEETQEMIVKLNNQNIKELENMNRSLNQLRSQFEFFQRDYQQYNQGQVQFAEQQFDEYAQQIMLKKDDTINEFYNSQEEYEQKIKQNISKFNDYITLVKKQFQQVKDIQQKIQQSTLDNLYQKGVGQFDQTKKIESIKQKIEENVGLQFQEVKKIIENLQKEKESNFASSGSQIVFNYNIINQDSINKIAEIKHNQLIQKQIQFYEDLENEQINKIHQIQQKNSQNYDSLQQFQQEQQEQEEGKLNNLEQSQKQGVVQQIQELQYPQPLNNIKDTSNNNYAKQLISQNSMSTFSNYNSNGYSTTANTAIQCQSNFDFSEQNSSNNIQGIQNFKNIKNLLKMNQQFTPQQVQQSPASSNRTPGKYFLSFQNKACLLNSQKIIIFDIATQQWEMKQLKFQYDIQQREAKQFQLKNHGIAVYLQGSKVFYSGGGPSNTSYILDFQDEIVKITEMPQSLDKRIWHAAYYIRPYIYVIGGFNGAERLSACERIDIIKKEKYEPLPQMHEPRSLFGSCLVNNNIYVFGGLGRC